MILRPQQIDGSFRMFKGRQGSASLFDRHQLCAVRPVGEELVEGIVLEQRDVTVGVGGVGVLRLISAANGENEVGEEDIG